MRRGRRPKKSFATGPVQMVAAPCAALGEKAVPRLFWRVSLLAGILAGPLFAHGNCEEVLAALLPEDFPHSAMYHGAGLASPWVFPTWAARTVEELRGAVRQRRPWAEILATAARRRGELALALPDPNASPASFGRRRPGSLRHVIGMTRDTPPDARRRLVDEGVPSSPLRDELANLASELAGPAHVPSVFPGSQKVRVRRTRYIALDGTPMGATDVFVEVDGPSHGVVSIMNGFPKHVDPILKDVFARLDLARAATDPAVRERELYAAIYGYYQACPYERGTAAVGQVFWSAVGTEVLGRKLVLPDGTDVRGMLMDQDAFVRWLAERNR